MIFLSYPSPSLTFAPVKGNFNYTSPRPEVKKKQKSNIKSPGLSKRSLTASGSAHLPYYFVASPLRNTNAPHCGLRKQQHYGLSAASQGFCNFERRATSHKPRTKSIKSAATCAPKTANLKIFLSLWLQRLSKNHTSKTSKFFASNAQVHPIKGGRPFTKRYEKSQSQIRHS